MPRKAQVPGGPTGVRLNPKQDERCRSAIQTTALLQRLNAFALERPDERSNGQPVVMSEGQIRAAVALLRKTIPDLAVTAHVGEDGGPIRIVTGVIRDGE
jgi:hypothetical protein